MRRRRWRRRQKSDEDAGAVADRRHGDKDAAAAQGGRAAQRENFSLAVAAKSRARRPTGARRRSAAAAAARAETGGATAWPRRALLWIRGCRRRAARLALVQPTSKPPPLIEEATPCLEFVAVYGAFDAMARAPRARAPSKARTRLAARAFGRGDLAVNARRALPRSAAPTACLLCGNQQWVGCVITESGGVGPTPPRPQAARRWRGGYAPMPNAREFDFHAVPLEIMKVQAAEARDGRPRARSSRRW